MKKYTLRDRHNDLKIFCENELARSCFDIGEWQSPRRARQERKQIEQEAFIDMTSPEVERDAAYLAEMREEALDDERGIGDIQAHGSMDNYRRALSEYFAERGVGQGQNFDFNILRDNEKHAIWLKFDPFLDCLEWRFDVAFAHSMAMQFISTFIDDEYCDLNTLLNEIVLVRTFNTAFKDCGIGLFWRLSLNAGVRLIEQEVSSYPFAIMRQHIEQETGKHCPFETAADFQAALNDFLQELKADLFKTHENANINILQWERGFYSGRWNEPIGEKDVINQCRSELFIGSRDLADMGWYERAADSWAVLCATAYLNRFFIKAQKDVYNFAEQEVQIWHTNAVQKQNELVELELNQIARRKLPEFQAA